METETKKDPAVERIKAIMERRGWTTQQTAYYLGVPQGTFGNWMNGSRSPSKSVTRLLDVLAVMEALAPGIHERFLPDRKRVDEQTDRVD